MIKQTNFTKIKILLKERTLYLNILMHDPEHPQTNNNLGLTYRNLNEINKAINCFKIALKRDDNYTIALNNLAKCLHEVDNIED